jgi:hypothetical protein
MSAPHFKENVMAEASENFSERTIGPSVDARRVHKIVFLPNGSLGGVLDITYEYGSGDPFTRSTPEVFETFRYLLRSLSTEQQDMLDSCISSIHDTVTVDHPPKGS